MSRGFFNFSKVQKDFLSAAIKAEEKRTQCDFFTAHEAEKKITFISNGHFFVAVPDSMCFVSGDDKDFLRRINAEAFDKMMPAYYSEDQRLQDTNTTIKKDRDVYHILKNRAGEDIFINEKYYSYFAGMECRLYSESKNAPVALWVLDRCVGIILTVKM